MPAFSKSSIVMPHVESMTTLIIRLLSGAPLWTASHRFPVSLVNPPIVLHDSTKMGIAGWFDQMLWLRLHDNTGPKKVGARVHAQYTRQLSI